MSITKGFRWFVVLALLLAVTATASRAGTKPSPEPSDSRQSTVVVKVSDDGFDWADASLGAAASLAATLLTLGLVLALRPDPARDGNP